MAGSHVDYDNDGDISEGVYYEIAGLQEQLYSALQAYAAEVAGTAIVYESHSYPYFFVDTNADGDEYADPNTHPDTHKHGYGHVDAHTHSDANPNVHSIGGRELLLLFLCE